MISMVFIVLLLASPGIYVLGMEQGVHFDDMVMTEDQLRYTFNLCDGQPCTDHAAFTSDPTRKWPSASTTPLPDGKPWKAVLPWKFGRYEFDSATEQKIRTALDVFNNKLNPGDCIKLYEIPRGSESRFPNYVQLEDPKPQSFCNANVGKMRWSPQTINLPGWCSNSPGSVIHEFTHALGRHHEQNRPDRNNHVKVYSNNHNYARQVNALTYDYPYEYESIMHYPFDGDMDNVGISDMRPIDPATKKVLPRSSPVYRKIQREGPTDLDITKVRAHYGCSEDVTVTGKGSCKDNVTWVDKDGDRCTVYAQHPQYCTWQAYKEAAKQFCRVSCNSCSEGKACSDDANWVDQDGDGCTAYENNPAFCEHDLYKAAKKFCRVSCNSCSSTGGTQGFASGSLGPVIKGVKEERRGW